MDAETAKKGVLDQDHRPVGGRDRLGGHDVHPADGPEPAERVRVSRTTCSTRRPTPRRTARCLQGPGVEASIPMLSADAKALYPFDDIDNYLNNTLTFNRGWPHEPDGDRATYDQVIAAWEAGQGFLGRGERVPLSRRLAAFLLTPFGALLLLAVTVPVAMLFAFSFFHIDALLRLAPGFTTDNYRRVADDHAIPDVRDQHGPDRGTDRACFDRRGLRPGLLPRVPRRACRARCCWSRS